MIETILEEFDNSRGDVFYYPPPDLKDSPAASFPDTPTKEPSTAEAVFNESLQCVKHESIEDVSVLLKKEELEQEYNALEDERPAPIRARSWSRSPLSNRLERLHL